MTGRMAAILAAMPPVDQKLVNDALSAFMQMGDEQAQGELDEARRAAVFEPGVTPLVLWRYMQAALNLMQGMLALRPEVRHAIGEIHDREGWPL